MNREELIRTLQSLSELELAKIFYAAYKSRRKGADDDLDDVYVVGNAGLTPNDDSSLIYISALSADPSDEAKKFLHTGKCSRCKIDIQCSSKDAICPVCNAQVDCT